MALKVEFIQLPDFKTTEGQFNLLISPFVCDTDAATEELHMELIILKPDNYLKRLFENKPLVQFYASNSKKALKSEQFCEKDVCIVYVNLHL